MKNSWNLNLSGFGPTLHVLHYTIPDSERAFFGLSESIFLSMVLKNSQVQISCIKKAHRFFNLKQGIWIWDPGTLGKSISNTEMKCHAGIWGEILQKDGCRKFSIVRMKCFLDFFKFFCHFEVCKVIKYDASKLGKILIKCLHACPDHLLKPLIIDCIFCFHIYIYMSPKRF